MPAVARDSERPEGFIPDHATILSVVRARPGICLKDLCGILWPSLSWSPAAPGSDSATMRLRAWPGASTRTSAAQWLADRLNDMAAIGVVRYGPAAPECDRMAGLTIYAVEVPAIKVGRA